MFKRLCFSPFAAHAPTTGLAEVVCPACEREDRHSAAAAFFGVRRAVSGLRARYVGGSGEIRTRDQRIKSPLLYRLSYRPPFEEGRMLATTPPPVKPQSCICAVIAATGLPTFSAPGQPRKRGFLSGVIATDGLISKHGIVLGVTRRTGVELSCRSQPEASYMS